MNTQFVTPGSHSGYANKPETKAPDWHDLVAWDLLFNNLATGLFLVAALGELGAPSIFTPVANVAYPLALVLLVVDLSCLVLDLGDPWRFHHMLRVFKPSSPMSLGTWSLTMFSLPLTALVATELLPGDWTGRVWIRKASIVIALLPALASALYKGVLLSTNAQPGWKDARWLGGYLANSAIMLGCAEMLALSVFLGQDRAAAMLGPALAALLVLNMIPLCLLIANLRPTLSRLYSFQQRFFIGLLVLGVGMLIPLCLLFVAGVVPIVLAPVVLIMVGSLVVRFVIIRIPHANGER